MKKARIALIGIGGYGHLYLDKLLDMKNENVELIALAEPFPESCKRLDEIKEKNIPIYESCDELFRHEKADLTVISTPIMFHTENIITALENDSNVLCEKPICADEKDIENIKNAQKKSGKFVRIGYQWSYSDAILTLKKDILSGIYGKCLSAKTIVLWPRGRKYFSRSCGWAGKISLDDGKKVYDSVLGNATAHYLHNILYLLGDDGSAMLPDSIDATLIRANDIENFDTAHVRLGFSDGFNADIIATHAVKDTLDPTFEIRFKNATVIYSQRRTEVSERLVGEKYSDFGKIVAYRDSGEKKVYGNPFENELKKLDIAINAVTMGDITDGPCGVSAASAHTKVINRLQNNFKITPAKPSLIKEDGDTVYIDRLFEKMCEIYSSGEGSLDCFKNGD